jgi:N4-gp56 family major capsid protein
MATTDYGVNHPLAVKHWSKDLMVQALKKTAALQYMGKDSNSVVQIKTELNKAAGDRIRFGLRMQLQGDGIVGDAVLEGNEEDLVTYSQDIYIDQLRHAVRSGGKMSEQRVPFSVRAEARDGLADWWADRIDTAFFNQLAGAAHVTDVRYTGMQAATAPDAGHVLYATPAGVAGHNTEASVSTTDVFHLQLIDKAVEIAKLATNTIRPIRVGGENKYVMFLHPYQVTDLRTNTNTGQWLDIQKAALSGGRSSGSSIYTGALGEYNGVVLQEALRVPLGEKASVRRAILVGAQAGAIAFGKGYGKNTFDWTEELFDYKNQLGVAAGCIWGLQKNRYNGSDFATVVVSSYAAAHT